MTVYCGNNEDIEEKKDSQAGYKVVSILLEGHEHTGHIVVTCDNFSLHLSCFGIC